MRIYKIAIIGILLVCFAITAVVIHDLRETKTVTGKATITFTGGGQVIETTQGGVTTREFYPSENNKQEK